MEQQAEAIISDTETTGFKEAEIIQMREGPDADPLTWDRLWEISEVARIPTKMTFGEHEGEKIEDIPYSYVSWLMRQPDLDPYLEKALRARK